MKLSKHFVQRWQRRVGGTPTPQQIENLIKRAVRVQPCKLLYEKFGVPKRILAIYWDPGTDVIVKVDDYHRVAVTVLTGKACAEEGR